MDQFVDTDGIVRFETMKKMWIVGANRGAEKGNEFFKCKILITVLSTQKITAWRGIVSKRGSRKQKHATFPLFVGNGYGDTLGDMWRARNEFGGKEQHRPRPHGRSRCSTGFDESDAILE